MMFARDHVLSLFALLVPVSLVAQQAPSTTQGIFQGTSDIGTAQEGASRFDPATQTYRLSGGGDDVWGAADAFRFTWTKLAKDGTLSADIQVLQPSTYPKAKGMLMIRESLDPGSPYADIAVHADGHITLQYRLTPGGETKDTNMAEHGTVRLEISRRNNVYKASILSSDAHPASVSLSMKSLAYVGLGVCSHSTTALQTVLFSNVNLHAGTK